MNWTEQDLAKVMAKRKGKGGENRKSVSPVPGRPRGVGSKPAPSPQYDSKLEARYAQYLHCLKYGKEIDHWHYHPFTLLLPGGIKYTPDFAVCYDSGFVGFYRVEIHELKGHMRMKNVRDSVTRLRIAQGLFPWLWFKIISRSKGQWIQVG